MSHVQNLIVTDNEDGMRLDRWFKAHFPEIRFGQLQRMLRTGQIRIDSGRVQTNTRLETGQSVRVPPLKPEEAKEKTHTGPTKLHPSDLDFIQSLVIFKDDDLLVLNKPTGLAVQGGSKTGRHIDGLLDGLQFDAPERPRLVHRLDKDTSGVLLLARTRLAATALSQSFKSRSARKTYWALVNGVPRYKAGEITLPLRKTGPHGQEKMRIAERSDKQALPANTHYEIIECAAQKFAWLAMSPVTGRTHQLRVHALGLGHSIVGDGKYGGSAAHPGGEIPKHLHLHSYSMELPHPNKKGKSFKISAPLPEHMAKTWELLQFNLAPVMDKKSAF
ncbi:MAG: RluA family pseudouridine synthase [Pseudomonadota bacterium]